MSGFEPERLIPFIRITRKIAACDNQQKVSILQQLPHVFDSHGLTSVLMNHVFSALFGHKACEKIPSTMYDDIESILPTDAEVNLKDSIYESCLVEEPGDVEVDNESAEQKSKKSKLNLLRTPTDLQCHLFHFLNFKDLINVQGVCRALCIAARNPCSVYRLPVRPIPSSEFHFFNECYSRPKLLSVHPTPRNNFVDSHLIGNAKWRENVTDLRIHYEYNGNLDSKNLCNFVNLETFEITMSRANDSPHMFLNGQIASYHTLRVLSLKGITLTEEIINHIQKFKNLEFLSVREWGANSNHSQKTDLIVLPRLKRFSFSLYTLSEIFLRILIGSHPQTVSVDSWQLQEGFSIAPNDIDAALRAIRAVKYLNLKLRSLEIINFLCPLLRKAHLRNHAFLEECALTYEVIICDLDLSIQPIISLFECAKTSKFHMICQHMDAAHAMEYNIPKRIMNADFGALSEVAMDVTFEFGLKDALHSVKLDDSGESDNVRVRDVVMKEINEAEKWMKSWLIFDEMLMKRIGLRKLDITFAYSINTRNRTANLRRAHESRNISNRLRAVLNEKWYQWSEQRVAAWTDIDQRCIATVKVFGHLQAGYIVTLSLPA